MSSEFQGPVNRNGFISFAGHVFAAQRSDGNISHVWIGITIPGLGGATDFALQPPMSERLWYAVNFGAVGTGRIEGELGLAAAVDDVG